MKIKSARFSYFRNNEHFQFHTEVKDLLTAESTVRVKVNDPLSRFLSAYNNEDDALVKISKSATTEEMEISDKKRAHTFRGAVDATKSALNHFDPQVCSAAKRLKIVFDTYGNLAALPLNEKTSAIYNLIQELTGRSVEEVQKVGLTEWVTELDNNNKAFELLVKKRNDEHAAKTELRVVVCRKELDAAYYEIVEIINALIIIEGIELFEPFVRKLNTFIDKYNQIVAHRSGK